MKKLLFVFASLLYCASVQSAELPKSGKHNTETHTAMYDQGCCSGNDCEPIPNNAVLERHDGYYVHYYSQAMQVEVEGIVPYGVERKSNGCTDGMCYHACAIPKYRSIGTCSPQGGSCKSEIDPTQGPFAVRCLYVVTMF